MFRTNLLRRGSAALVLLAALVLTSVPATAEPSAPTRQPAIHRAHPGLVSSFWHFLTSLFGREGGVTDPNGKPLKP
jgi:hypothetical protein